MEVATFLLFNKGSFMGWCVPQRCLFEADTFILFAIPDKANEKEELYVLYFKDLDYGVLITKDIKNSLETCD